MADGGCLRSRIALCAGSEIEAQPRLGSIAEPHRAKVHGVRVDVVDRHAQLPRKLLRIEELVRRMAGAIKHLYDAVRGPLGDRLDVPVIERSKKPS